MTAVLVVEDQRALATALEFAIGSQPDLECMGAVATVEDALARMAGRAPDVVVMDIGLPGTDGIEGTRQIMRCYPGTRVLILTGTATRQHLAAAAQAGAAGFLGKDSALPDILAAVRDARGGKMVIEGATLADLLADLGPGGGHAADERARRAREADWAGLTDRERDVLALMGEGLDARTIAGRLTVSLHTARGHIKKILMKLGAHSQLEAVVIATRSGLLPGRSQPAGPPPAHPRPARPSLRAR